MPKMKSRRKQLFRAALAIKGIGAGQFAATLDVTPEHLSRVLNGKRESRSLTAKIDGFIREHLPGHPIALAS